MGNLAISYSILGWHQDAIAMKEKTLEFQRRVLPENHPDISRSCLNLGLSFSEIGDSHRALKCFREALRILQVTLPPTHPHVAMAQQLVREHEDDTARRL
jgi:hypothetical protein